MALVSTSVLVVEQAAANCCRHHLCSQKESQLPPASLGSSPRLASGSDPASCLSNYCLCAGSQCVRFCEYPLIVKSCFLQPPLALLYKSLVGLQSRCFGDSSSQCRTPGLGSLMWGSDLRFSWRRTSAFVIILLFVGCLPRGVGLDYTVSLPLLPICCSSFFISLVVENLFC